PGRASGCTLCRGRAWTAAGVARPADNAASGPPRANETRSCGQSPASGRWPISKGLWRTTLEPATQPHLCTSRLLLLAEFGDGVLQRWGFFIPAILRNMFPAVGCADVFLDFMKPHLDSHDTPSDSSRLETS